MTELEVREVVAQSIGQALRRDIAVYECVQRDSEQRWDSLSHAMIMFSIEDAFGIKFSENELEMLKSSDELLQAVIKHLEAHDKSVRTSV